MSFKLRLGPILHFWDCLRELRCRYLQVSHGRGHHVHQLRGWQVLDRIGKFRLHKLRGRNWLELNRRHRVCDLCCRSIRHCRFRLHELRGRQVLDRIGQFRLHRVRLD